MKHIPAQSPSVAATNGSKIPDEHKIGGFAVGCQAYTFHRFTVFEAIEKTAQAGGKVIEFSVGQALRPQERTVYWNHNSPDEVIDKVKAKLAEHQILAVNYGVVFDYGVVCGQDEAEWRKIFEFAEKLNLYAITTEDIADLDLIEKLVEEFDIKVCIHQHFKCADDPSYKLWDPNFVLTLLKDRDRRIGVCADTGHWASSGLKPVDCLNILKGRVISAHLKDRAKIGEALPDQPFGTGVCDVKGMLDELKAQGFEGHLSIEYENNWDHSVPEVAQCVGFIRGWGSANK